MNLFCFVLKHGRLSQAAWEMLVTYQELLGREFWDHAACIITHVDYVVEDGETLEAYEQRLAAVEESFQRQFEGRLQARMA